MASRIQAGALIAALRALVASSLCMWRPQHMYLPRSGGDLPRSDDFYDDHVSYGGRRRHSSNVKPTRYENFSAAADACNSMRSHDGSNLQCSQIVCTEDFCVAPAGGDSPGRAYTAQGDCYRPKSVNGYCNRRAAYRGHPCKADGSDFCCEGSCRHCGPAGYCRESFGTHHGQCNPHYSGDSLCKEYFQACDEGPNGRTTHSHVNFSSSAPTPAPPPPLTAVQLGGGWDSLGCSRHGLSPVMDQGMCELLAQSFGFSTVKQCNDEKECAARPYGCIVQARLDCPSCGGGAALMNLHGQGDRCGVGASSYDRWDCICIGRDYQAPGQNSSLLSTVDQKRREAEQQARLAEEKAKNATAEAEEARSAAEAAGTEVSTAKQELLEAQRTAEQAKTSAYLARKAAAERLTEAEAQWQKQAEVSQKLKAEVKELMEMAAKKKEWGEGQNAANHNVQIMQQQQHMAMFGLAFVGGLTTLLLLLVVCALGFACFTFSYARLGRDARDVRVTELQDAFVQSEPTAEFSQI